MLGKWQKRSPGHRPPL